MTFSCTDTIRAHKYVNERGFRGAMYNTRFAHTHTISHGVRSVAIYTALNRYNGLKSVTHSQRHETLGTSHHRLCRRARSNDADRRIQAVVLCRVVHHLGVTPLKILTSFVFVLPVAFSPKSLSACRERGVAYIPSPTRRVFAINIFLSVEVAVVAP